MIFNKTKQNLIVITETSREDYCDTQNVYVYNQDDEDGARAKFEELRRNDKNFLRRENREDEIQDDCEDWYRSFPEGDYSETMYEVRIEKA